VPRNESEFSHILYVYDNLLSKIKSKIYIACHSFGGFLSSQILHDREKQIFQNPSSPSIVAIAFCDSVHKLNPKFSDNVISFLYNNCKNWGKSKLKKGTKMSDVEGTPRYSSGTEDHDIIPFCVLNEIAEFFESF